MDKYIVRSLKIVSGEWEVDKQSFYHAFNELKNRIQELTPVFNEFLNKGLNIRDYSPELSDEWNEINLTLIKAENEITNESINLNKTTMTEIQKLYDSLFNKTEITDGIAKDLGTKGAYLRKKIKEDKFSDNERILVTNSLKKFAKAQDEYNNAIK